MDLFDKDFKQGEELCNKLRNQIAEIKMNKSGQGISTQKYLMKSTYNTLSTTLMKFDQLVYEYTNEPSRHPGLSEREIKKRMEKIKQLKETAENNLFVEYKAIENDSVNQYESMEAERLMRGEDGEFDETRDIEN